MTKAQPLSKEQMDQLRIWVDQHPDLHNLYHEQFTQECKYYDQIKLYYHRGNWSDDVFVLSSLYYYEKLKPIK